MSVIFFMIITIMFLMSQLVNIAFTRFRSSSSSLEIRFSSEISLLVQLLYRLFIGLTEGVDIHYAII